METPGTHDKTYLQQWYDDIAFWRGLKRWRQEHPTSLFTASVLAIAMLAVFAGALWLVLGFALGDDWPWELANPDTSRYTVTRMVLFILAGAVGVVGVVVAYRRQHSAEQGRFLEQLAEASRLLGDPNPTVQAAGTYALAGLADTEGRARRQQCVDVLCAYIRLPYAPAPEGQEPQALESTNHTRTLSTETGTLEEQRTLFRPHDRHTRETIIRVITQHLRTEAAVSWSDLDFDFTGAVFDYGDFSDAVFTSGTVDFGRAQFTGGTVNFAGAQFASGTVNFAGAQFTGGTVHFGRVQFTGGTVNFAGAQFTGGIINFGGAQFTGGTVHFGRAQFTGGTVNFKYAQFTDGTVNFGGAQSAAAQFTGGTVNFGDAQFTGGTVQFWYAQFAGGIVNFGGAQFAGGIVNFGDAQFTGGTVNFGYAQFAGSTVNFSRAQFAGGTVNFSRAQFAGGTVSFKYAQFASGTVNFNTPYAWTTPPQVPWVDRQEPPIGVLPREWPPSLSALSEDQDCPDQDLKGREEIS